MPISVPSPFARWIKEDGSPSPEVYRLLQALAAGISGGDMLKSVYDTDNDEKVGHSVLADSVPWAGLTGDPPVLAPGIHDHDDRYYTESEADVRLNDKLGKVNNLSDLNNVPEARGNLGFGALTLNELIIGGGGTNAPVALGTLGTTTTVLHGNASGAPSFAQVNLTTTVTGVLPTANGGTGITATPASFSVHRSNVNQVIATNTFTKIEFTEIEYDTNDDFDVSTNHRYTPTIAGKYIISLQATILTLATDKLVLSIIYKNGSISKINGSVIGASNDGFAQVVAIIDMNGSTDYIEGFVYHENGSNRDLRGNTIYTYMTGVRIGA